MEFEGCVYLDGNGRSGVEVVVVMGLVWVSRGREGSYGSC